MLRERWSLHDAKNKFSALVEAAVKGKPQFVNRRGRPAVVVLSEEEYERLTAAAKADAPSFAEHLLAMPQDDGGFEDLPLRPRDVDF